MHPSSLALVDTVSCLSCVYVLLLITQFDRAMRRQGKRAGSILLVVRAMSFADVLLHARPDAGDGRLPVFVDLHRRYGHAAAKQTRRP